jgi:hypothetical protein
MFRILASIAIACSFASFIIPIAANANSVMDTKTKIREAVEIWDGDNCFGVCSTSRVFAVCNLVKNLDRQVGGIIAGRAAKGKSRLLSIDKPDLELMQLISSQCKPFEGELPPALKRIDVKNNKSFSPSCQALPKIRQGLGLERFGGEHYRNNCSSKNKSRSKLSRSVQIGNSTFATSYFITNL